MYIAFTAAVVRTDRLFVDVGESDGGDNMQILPCGWAWGDVISRDLYGGNRSLETSQLNEMVYETYAFSGMFGAEALGKKEEWKGSLDQVVDPVPVEPRRGSCFRLVGKVTEVHGCEIEVFVKQEERMFAKGFEKAVTVHLPEGVEKPEIGSAHVFKGVLEPFTKAFKDMKFMAEVCEKMEAKSS